MNSRHVVILAGLAFAAGGITSAQAEEKPWSLSVYAGGALSGSGTFRRPKQVSVPSPAAIDPRLAGAPATVAIDKLNYEDVFDYRYTAGLELGYTPRERVQVYLRANYSARQGKRRDIGSLSTPLLTGRREIFADFGDSDSQSLEAGVRYTWVSESPWRPFVGLSLGATHTDDVKASISIRDTAIQRREVHFASAGTAFSQSAETGIEYRKSPRLGFRFSVRADHVAEPHGASDRTLADLGFRNSDQAYSRYTFPFTVAAVYNF